MSATPCQLCRRVSRGGIEIPAHQIEHPEYDGEVMVDVPARKYCRRCIARGVETLLDDYWAERLTVDELRRLMEVDERRHSSWTSAHEETRRANKAMQAEIGRLSGALARALDAVARLAGPARARRRRARLRAARNAVVK